jgi:hypothetical protein
MCYYLNVHFQGQRVKINKSNNNEMDRTCGTYGGEKHAGLLWENVKERDQLEDLGVHGRIILKCTSFLKKECGGLHSPDSGCVEVAGCSE